MSGGGELDARLRRPGPLICDATSAAGSCEVGNPHRLNGLVPGSNGSGENHLEVVLGEDDGIAPGAACPHRAGDDVVEVLRSQAEFAQPGNSQLDDSLAD